LVERFEFHLHIQGPDTVWDYQLPSGVVSIGRQVGNELVLDSPQVSRLHAELSVSTNECLLTDLGSSNGTRLNGELLASHTPVTLSDGALIAIGPFLITIKKVLIEAEPLPEKAEEQLSGAEAELAEEAAREPAYKPQVLAEVAVQTGRMPQPSGSGDGAPNPPAQTPAQPVEPGAVAATVELIPPSLSIHSRRLLSYLPGIYHTDFMARFLGIFEAILTPIEWDIDNFDLFLDPGTAPADFLPWLANWYEISLNPAWSEGQRRTFLKEAHQIYARRGTRWALVRLLEIYTGCTAEIFEFQNEKEPFTFIVKLPLSREQVNQELIENLVDANKPAHTSYSLEFAN
jgi:phage tail-like protein